MKNVLSRPKHFLRQYFRDRVKSLPAGQKRREALAVARRVASLPVFRQARTVALYRSLPHEMDVAALWVLCRHDRKTVVLPRADIETKRLTFFEWTPASLFELNPYGILEPSAERSRQVPASDLDLLVVPGAAFTPRGERLGSGGGFYDRFLAEWNIPTLAPAHLCQMATRLPLEKHDRPLSFIATPEAIHRR